MRSDNGRDILQSHEQELGSLQCYNQTNGSMDKNGKGNGRGVMVWWGRYRPRVRDKETTMVVI